MYTSEFACQCQIYTAALFTEACYNSCHAEAGSEVYDQFPGLKEMQYASLTYVPYKGVKEYIPGIWFLLNYCIQMAGFEKGTVISFKGKNLHIYLNDALDPFWSVCSIFYKAISFFTADKSPYVL